MPILRTPHQRKCSRYIHKHRQAAHESLAISHTEENMMVLEQTKHMCGQFLWTFGYKGDNYISEPTFKPIGGECFISKTQIF